MNYLSDYLVVRLFRLTKINLYKTGESLLNDENVPRLQPTGHIAVEPQSVELSTEKCHLLEVL